MFFMAYAQTSYQMGKADIFKTHLKVYYAGRQKGGIWYCSYQTAMDLYMY